MSNQSFRNNNPTDIAISKLVGLETYKALYTLYPEFYSYISDPLVPTLYFIDLVQGVIASSGLNYEEAGNVIYNTLKSLSDSQSEPEVKNVILVTPLINSSFAVENMQFTFWENVIWISIVTFLAFFIIFYLYIIGTFEFIFNVKDGITCSDCKSMFDYIKF
jgi:hypothetical protein